MALRTLLDETLSAWTQERPDLEFDVMGTFLRLALLMHAGVRVIEDAIAGHGVNLGEFDVLAALRRSGAGASLTPSTLARVAMVSPAGMTNRLDRLERSGLVDRRPDPDDRRGSLVTLTARGTAVIDRAIESLVAAEAALVADVSEAERHRFDRTLDKLLARFDAEHGG
jgi:DNA-binding MarR family transcriptional regulator